MILFFLKKTRALLEHVGVYRLPSAVCRSNNNNSDSHGTEQQRKHSHNKCHVQKAQGIATDSASR